MAKLSILLLYMEMFRPNIMMRYCIYFCILFVCLFYIAASIIRFALIIPKKGQNLYKSFAYLTSSKQTHLVVVHAVVNIITDFSILCLPILGVWQLQLPIPKKIGISAVFMTGLL